MNYAQAQYSTDSGKADILNYLLAGKHDDADIKIAACYMSKSLRVGTMRECVALVKAAIASQISNNNVPEWNVYAGAYGNAS